MRARPSGTGINIPTNILMPCGVVPSWAFRRGVGGVSSKISRQINSGTIRIDFLMYCLPDR